ncbi:hypothetical protein G6N82_10350 [Altererythrobacter sp. BO-6]|uniref:DUF4145 domain-containing protein n=1 Tax=Altererythrobacter sp. BO-6 TaxID=2604537 RepID=UPI0013E1336F|nr:DUF4145 domain-containing protein [Altererythrobacter sp. BO-6]QIG54498.1 hypothetical protein G6N82_10350 [Altererythrobacter sp. BO-6]
MSELNPTEQFRLRFAQLRGACNDSPSALITFFREKASLVELAWRADSAANLIDRASAFRKIHAQVTPEFMVDWRAYNQHWRAQVSYVIAANLDDQFGDPEMSFPPFEIFAAKHEKASSRESANAEFENEFIAEFHDGAKAIEELKSLLEQQAVDWFDPDFMFIPNTYRIGVQALEYFEQVIGIDFDGAFDRWNNLPVVFVPRHVSDKHGLTSKAGLYALFNEAVRSYVAGAPAAAAAMCRAILELVLKKHYLADEQTDFVSLKKLINIAVARYSFIDGQGMHSFRENANAILHGYVTTESSLAISDQAMLKIFQDLKHFIEEAPET